MNCGYCQFTNSEHDHRCGRCGRRLVVTAAQVGARASGANALSLAHAPAPAAAQRPARSAPISLDAAATLDSLPVSRLKRTPDRAAQPSLFGAEMQPRIIPFDSLPKGDAPREAAPRDTPSAPAKPLQMPAAPAAVKSPARRAAAAGPANHPANDPQATLDFLPPVRSSGRTLKTNATAAIFCDAAVAAPVHRATAAALDLCMIVIASGAMLALFREFAHPVALSRSSWFLLAAMVGVVALWYGLLFAVAGRLTPGMRWAGLRLINFDGFPLEGRHRALRLTGAWISVLSGGIGLLWALLDEEGLTWHDHMSKSFPTLLESNSIVVRQRA